MEIKVKDSGRELINDEMSDRIIEAATAMATENGAHTVTVSRILTEIGITNRVFYNRFYNIDQVLEVVYRNAVLKMHESLSIKHYDESNFFEYVMNIAVDVLIKTYDIKMQFSRYMFEHDSLTAYNYKWWTGEIKKLIQYAVTKGLIRDVNADMLSYTIWCFCRGFNTDAVSRKLSREEAVEYFKFGFGCFVNGLAVKK